MSADYLAVLWFGAEAEDVPTRLMKVYLSEERLMASELYQSIFAKGEAQGIAKGEAQGWAKGAAQAEASMHAETIIRILDLRLGTLEPALRERIRGLTDRETLRIWFETALGAVDVEGARRLVETIRKAPAP